MSPWGEHTIQKRNLKSVTMLNKAIQDDNSFFLKKKVISIMPLSLLLEMSIDSLPASVFTIVIDTGKYLFTLQ